MTRCSASASLGAVLALLVACVAPAAAQTAERIVEIRVHGNHTTPDDQVVALSGLSVGDPATPDALKVAEDKLQASRRFEGVEVRRRFASIEDANAILVVLVVDEREGVSANTPLPGPLRRLGLASLWMPILNFIDGYGFTYGARISFADPIGPQTRMSIPLTWGGERRAALEVERTFQGKAWSSVSGAIDTYRRVNPHFEIADLRVEGRARVERRFTPWLRAGAAARIARVDFGGDVDTHDAEGVDVTFDTRIDPSFPRNAVHMRLGWEHMGFEAGSAGMWKGDLRGYVGVGGSRVLALRAQFARASAALPPSEQLLLGGSDTLRGYRTGYRANDRLAAASAELRVPLSSPFSFARLGVKGFVDAGTVWSSSARLADQPFDHGIGGGFYAGIAALMLDVDVAWPESGSPHVHVGLGVTF
ncbi:MAG TPA: BamA/TamA family outer membrane protein [Vicinamibacterales bacterium]|nr:BamA/TamA family outer membrane protein [Vicinamibacterales bacterium]